jgi:hypothetical protein
MLRVFVEPDIQFDKEVRYTWDLFCRNNGLSYTWSISAPGSDLIIGTSHDASLRISRSFYQRLSEQKFHHSFHFDSEPLIKCEDGRPDYLSTAFYMLNSVQEKNHPVKDEYNRFPFSESYQYKFNCVTENLVQKYFDNLIELHNLKRDQKLLNKRTRIFLTHDIDTVHGSLLQDVFYGLKKINPVQVTSAILRNAKSPYWLNMSEMMDIESRHNFKSTFFWLTRKGRVNQKLSNSDYNIEEKNIRKQITRVSARGFFNGLHKSAAAAGFAEERDELGIAHSSNRYHYIKFNPPDDYQTIEDAGLKLDSSLGFAETHGFRNSYGLPFQPYHFGERRPLHFVEVPLHLMDTTFFNYKKRTGAQAFNEITKFVEGNKMNCVLTVLFHNNFISGFKYKEYKKLFVDLLEYFNRQNLECILEDEIIQSYMNGN